MDSNYKKAEDLDLGRNAKKDYVKMRNVLANKILIIAQKGGKCESCGIKVSTKSFHIDHINPTFKKIQYSNFIKNSPLVKSNMNKIQDELKHSRLLCSNCHHKRLQRYSDDFFEDAKKFAQHLSNIYSIDLEVDIDTITTEIYNRND